MLRWRWDGEPFGGGSIDNNPSGVGAFDFQLRFPGQIGVAETGLYYNYFRDYDPSTGRYIESDPIGLRAGPNTYWYGAGNPVSHFDPDGLKEQGVPFSENEMDQLFQRSCARRAFWQAAREIDLAPFHANRDKYFHCKANCQAAKCGKWGYDEACSVSDLKEGFNLLQGDGMAASAADQVANRVGRDGARESPGSTCQIICSRYRYDTLPAPF